MPRFFLHSREGDRFLEDPDGYEAEDIEEARHEAINSARDILAEKMKAGEVIDSQEFDICDESGNVIERVPFKSVYQIPER